jgi:hypothetical protein
MSDGGSQRPTIRPTFRAGSQQQVGRQPGDADVGSLCEAWANYIIESKRDLLCRNKTIRPLARFLPAVPTVRLPGLVSGGLPAVPHRQSRVHRCVPRRRRPGLLAAVRRFHQAELDANCAAAGAAACDPTDADKRSAPTPKPNARRRARSMRFIAIVQNCTFAKPIPARVPPACASSKRASTSSSRP